MLNKRLIGVAAAMLVGLGLVAVPTLSSPAMAAADCYTAVTNNLTAVLVDSPFTETFGPYNGSSHCNDVNIRATGSINFNACVIRTYQGQIDCSAATFVGTNWVVPSGGSAIPNGASFKVKVHTGSAHNSVPFRIAY